MKKFLLQLSSINGGETIKIKLNNVELENLKKLQYRASQRGLKVDISKDLKHVIISDVISNRELYRTPVIDALSELLT